MNTYRIRPFDPDFGDFDIEARSITAAADKAAIRMYGSHKRADAAAYGAIRQTGSDPKGPGNFIARNHNGNSVGRMFHVTVPIGRSAPIRKSVRIVLYDETGAVYREFRYDAADETSDGDWVVTQSGERRSFYDLVKTDIPNAAAELLGQ